ncbi:MAG TPA: hypothetical protein VKG87_06965 [Terriglobales bacterium]|nr:hypothetical protein [Terriglobales bacterium]
MDLRLRGISPVRIGMRVAVQGSFDFAQDDRVKKTAKGETCCAQDDSKEEADGKPPATQDDVGLLQLRMTYGKRKQVAVRR